MPSEKNFSRNLFVTIDKFSERVYNSSMKFSGCFVQYIRCTTDEHCNITVLDLEGNVVQKVLELK